MVPSFIGDLRRNFQHKMWEQVWSYTTSRYRAFFAIHAWVCHWFFHGCCISGLNVSTRHGHERIGRKDYGPAGLVLRSIKRRKVFMNLSLKYRCLGENVLAETLPDPTACTSKRKWETAIQKARETLRLMAPDVDPDTDVDVSLAGTDAVPCISAGCELELAESDGAPDFDGTPDFQWIWIWSNCLCHVQQSRINYFAI